jgi:hypothetical protein
MPRNSMSAGSSLLRLLTLRRVLRYSYCMTRALAFEINPQPDDRSCGVTCLDAVYAYHGLEIPLKKLIAEVEHLETGGTLAVMLACDALRRGFQATIYTYNLNTFDPTWFGPEVDLPAKLLEQAREKPGDGRLQVATHRYIEFLDLGGRLRFVDLNGSLIRRYLNRGLPILVGLSATYLYKTARETDDRFDDVRGTPAGHFVVLSGYDKEERTVTVADPLLPNPITSESQYYEVEMDRLIASILLGIVTYDANLLVVEPQGLGA